MGRGWVTTSFKVVQSVLLDLFKSGEKLGDGEGGVDNCQQTALWILPTFPLLEM